MRRSDYGRRSRRWLVGAKITTLWLALVAAPSARLEAQAAADSAWRMGDIALAERLYADDLEENPRNLLALHRLALIRAWDERYLESLELFDRLLVIEPRNLEATLDRAKVLAWRNELTRSIAAHERLLEEFPESRAVRLGLARVLSWNDQLDSAEVVYARILAVDSTDVEAMTGYARVATWRGGLVEGERRWRAAVTRHPEDPTALSGLGQTLRWQGRDAAALEYLERAAGLSPGDRDVRSELSRAQAAFAPIGLPELRYESDSDGNRIATASYRQTVWPSRRLGVEAAAYVRDARQEGESPGATSVGAFLELETLLEPGWRLSAGVGASRSDALGHALGAVSARATSPDRERVGGLVELSLRPLDETAVLIRNGVTIGEARLAFRAGSVSALRFDGGVSAARLDGSEPNRRLAVHGVARRRFHPDWSVGLSLRGFGFEKDLDDGYFDPSFYGLGEVRIDWGRSIGRWALGVEAAPGLQNVRRSTGDDSASETSATARAVARIGYEFAPGRVIGLRTVYSTTGLNSFSTGSANYRYVRVDLSARWTF